MWHLKDSDDSSPAGEGALVRLKGQDALNYLSEHYKNTDDYDIRAFYLSDKLVDEKGVREYFDKIIDNPEASPAEIKNDVKYAKGKGSKAVKYKPYTGAPVPALTENCVTVADEGLEKGGSNIIGTEWIPARLNMNMKIKDKFSKRIKEVTSTIKSDVEKGKVINVGNYE